MIGQLRGNLVSSRSDALIIDVQGVGYEVSVPASTTNKLPVVGAPLELKIYTHVREDQLTLYGFLSDAEKEIFQLLLSISGVGPKVALTVVSEISPNELVQTVLTGNFQRFKSIPGIGKKTAERLVLELREKVKKLSTTLVATDTPMKSDALMDLTSALSNLGYKQNEIDRAVSHMKTDANPNAKFEELLRKSLQYLRS